MVKSLLSYLRRRDYFAAQSVNQFIAISQFTKDKITETYNRNSNIIFSPIDLDRFAPLKHRGSHYLIVSRLEQWKRVDYAIEAFTQLGLPQTLILWPADAGFMDHLEGRSSDCEGRRTLIFKLVGKLPMAHWTAFNLNSPSTTNQKRSTAHTVGRFSLKIIEIPCSSGLGRRRAYAWCLGKVPVIARQYHLDARHFVRHNMFAYCRAKMRKRVMI